MLKHLQIRVRFRGDICIELFHRGIIDSAELLTMQNHWHCGTIDTTEPLTMRNHWQCGTIDTAEQLTLRNHWHCGTIDSAEQLTLRKNWQCGTIDTAEQLTVQDYWHCGTIKQCGTIDNAKPLTMRNKSEQCTHCEIINIVESLRRRNHFTKETHALLLLHGVNDTKTNFMSGTLLVFKGTIIYNRIFPRNQNRLGWIGPTLPDPLALQWLVGPPALNPSEAAQMLPSWPAMTALVTTLVASSWSST